MGLDTSIPTTTFNYVYDVNSNKSWTIDGTSGVSISNGLQWSNGSHSTTSCTLYNCGVCHPYHYYGWSYSYPVKETVYMYQITCPKCEKKTFGELDTVVTCKKCKSTIKLVSKKTDYEVAID